jgi:hypothetical protein
MATAAGECVADGDVGLLMLMGTFRVTDGGRRGVAG